MFVPQWLRQLQRTLFPRPTSTSRNTVRRASVRRRVWLSLESLEDRLAPSADLVTVAAGSLSTSFSENQQNLTLTANVSDATNSSTTVGEGAVSFTIKSSSGSAVGTAQGTVSNGKADASFTLPAGESAGSYTIAVSYTDSAGNFSDDGTDTPGTLAINATNVLVKANNLSATFSTTDEPLHLTASVTDPANSSDIVNEGTVSFAVKDSSGKQVGSTVQGNVSSGTASASFTLPASTAPGSYTIFVNYTDTPDNFTDNGTDTSGKLTVAATTTTTASNATANFSAQTVTLNAIVTSSGGTVNVGTVNFTLVDSNGKTIGSATSGTVDSSGHASVSYALPGGTPAGSYTIDAAYSDSTGAFAPSSDNIHTLTVSAASTSTKATSATAPFDSNAQNVTLSASVTSSAGTVNEGSVTFTLLDSNGNTVGTSTSGTVSNGQASVIFTLPGGTSAGSYTIDASYGDSVGNFAPSSDFTQTLTVGSASTTTLSLTTMNIVPNMSNSTAQVTLKAHVSNPSGVVNQGEVSITLGGVSGQGKVDNGTASVQLTVPIAKVSNLAKVALSYTDKDSPANFSDATTSATVAMNVWNVLLPTNLTFDASGNEQNQVSTGGNTSLLGFSYTSAGLLTQVLLDSSALPVTYSNVGGNTVTTFVGAPTAITFVGSNGQVLGDAQISYDGATLQWLLFDSNNHPIGETPYGI